MALSRTADRVRKRKRYREDPWSPRAASRRYYWKNRERCLERGRAWKRANKTRCTEVQRKRRAGTTYIRDWERRRKLSKAWRAWSAVCAGGRRALSV